jgi:hypothetical protein
LYFSLSDWESTDILGSTYRERLFLSAKGAECNSLGQRPRNKALTLEALKARNEVFRLRMSNHKLISRLQRFETQLRSGNDK